MEKKCITECDLLAITETEYDDSCNYQKHVCDQGKSTEED